MDRRMSRDRPPRLTAVRREIATAKVRYQIALRRLSAGGGLEPARAFRAIHANRLTETHPGR
jgi:hypothetical protein